MIRSSMKLATIVCLAGLSGLSWSCAAKQPPTAATLKPSPDESPKVSSVKPSAPKPVLAVSKYPVIVHVVSRGKTVTISSGPNGQVYSLAENDGGKVLIADASGEEFAKLQPELYRAIRGTIAVKSNDAFMWDGVETSEKKLDDEVIGIDLATSDRE